MASNINTVRQPAAWNLGRFKPQGLWVLQAALAALFVFAGAMKFVTPAEELTRDTDLTVSFLRFIGVCEVLGGIGLIVPGITRIQRGLTPFAGIGLVVIMIGAVVVTFMAGGIAPALFPLVVGLLTLLVVRSRWSWFGAYTRIQ